MIKTRNLDKYFNEGKQNSIHVINNTTLEFPNTGLVSLVGQSGSGKTTLLNVISGLDKAKGTIEFDDIVMNKYQSHKWDQIRSHDIGYVFQNYYLLEDRSVYDNIEITLNMIGIVDKEEVDYRIIYVLNAVGMYRYRNKKASDLSGGQKQRVAIARAIAKNPKVIIADEPTGNLDSANSIEVMKIIKKISQERLVVLVTHNMPLANKYSDRIISLADGVVVTDLENELAHQTELSFDDKNIYLGNLNNYTNDENIALYSNNETNDIQFTIVKINNNYFLKPVNDNVRINIIDKNSDIKLINAKKEEVAEDAYETNFSLDELDQVKSVRVKKRTLSFKEAVIAAFKKLFNMGKKAKIQMIALIMLGMMFSSAVHALVSNLVIDSSKVYVDKNVYQVTEIITDLNLDQSKYIQYTNNRSNVMGNALILNGRSLDFTVDGRYPLGAIKADKVTNGTYPKNVYEVLIDETVLNSGYANKYEFDVAGINNAKEFVGQKIVSNGIELTISGTVNTNTKGLYIHDVVMAQVNLKYNNLFPILDTDTVVLSSGRLPNNDLTKLGDIIEIVVPNTEKDVLDEIFTTEEFGNTHFKVVGVFTNEIIDTTHFYNPFFLEQEVIQMLINGLKVNSGFYPLVYSLDGKDIEGVKTKNLYTEQVDEIKMMKKVQMSASAIQMAVAIGISGLIFFFLVRSSLTSRVKEISILRSLGVSKYEVVSLFTVEYFILTAFTSFIGVLIGTVFTNVLYKSFIGEFLGVRVTPISALVAFVGIFITNIVLALIPVGLLLRKTPAAMLTNYDI